MFTVDYIAAHNHPEPIDICFHTHNWYEMVFYTTGNGIVEADDKAYEYENNSVIIMSPGLRHNEINLCPSYNIVVGFHFDVPSENIKSGRYNGDSQILNILKDMLSEIVEQKCYYDTMLSYQLGQVMLLLLRTVLNGESNDNSYSAFDLSYILNYIEENLMLPLTIGDLSRLSRYSDDRFRHIFKNTIGMPPWKYILHRRLEKAKRMLPLPDKSITEIALDCGFYDSAHFSRRFKTAYGKSPIEFKKMFCNK